MAATSPLGYTDVGTVRSVTDMMRCTTMMRCTSTLILLLISATSARSQPATSHLNATLNTGSLAGTGFSVSFSYDPSQVSPVGDSYAQLIAFDFTLLGVQFTRADIFQAGQVTFHNGVIDNVIASFQVIVPPNSPVSNITFGFGGPGVIGYADLNGQFGDGSFTIGDMIVRPSVTITANGQGGPLTLPPNSALQIAIAANGGTSGFANPSDLYIGVSGPFGLLWLTSLGLSPTMAAVRHGPLASFGPLPVLNFPNVSVLPSGSYVWFIAIAGASGTFSNTVHTIVQ
jgi:hypothetical protein